MVGKGFQKVIQLPHCYFFSPLLSLTFVSDSEKARWMRFDDYRLGF